MVTAAVYQSFNLLLAQLILTFQHRAGVSPYTSTFVLAETCVFDKQSLPPLMCHLNLVTQKQVLLLPKLQSQFAEFLQHHSLKRLSILYQSTCVGLEYGLNAVLFPGPLNMLLQSIKEQHALGAVTDSRLRNINLIPINYGNYHHLRGRLTLRGQAWRRKLQTFGEDDSHVFCATHASFLTSDTSTDSHKSASSAYRTLRYHSKNTVHVFGV